MSTALYLLLEWELHGGAAEVWILLGDRADLDDAVGFAGLARVQRRAELEPGVDVAVKMRVPQLGPEDLFNLIFHPMHRASHRITSSRQRPIKREHMPAHVTGACWGGMELKR